MTLYRQKHQKSHVNDHDDKEPETLEHVGLDGCHQNWPAEQGAPQQRNEAVKPQGQRI